MIESMYYTRQSEQTTPVNLSLDNFMNQFEEALKHEPCVIVSTITGAIEFLQQHPFPEVLNRVFNTLANVFNHNTIIPETKLILHRIVQLTRESKSFLHAYQTPEIMITVIMKVSHNLDPEIRALCLSMLEAMASVVCNDSHAQHLIIEGLNAPTLIEKIAAVVAVKQFVQYSKPFCELAIQKIDDLLFSPETDVDFKVKLIRILPYVRDGVMLCDRLYNLGMRLLNEKTEKELTIATLDLLTHVASKGVKVGEHVNFLMNALDEYHIEPLFVKTLFKNLAEISHSTQWEKDQVQRLITFSSLCENQKSTEALYYFLTCLREFSTIARFPNEVKKADAVLVGLLHHKNFMINVLSARIIVNLQSPNISANLTNAFPDLINRMVLAKPKEQRLLCKVITDYCATKSTTYQSVKVIIDALLNSASINSSAFKTILETMNAVCSHFTQIYPVAIDFAQKVLDESLQKVQEDVSMDGGYLPSFQPPLHLFSLLLAPKHVRLPSTIDVKSIVRDYAMKANFAIRYDIAVLGFRYGHWKEVSLPLLESLDLGILQATFIRWIVTLIGLSKTQPTNISPNDLSSSVTVMKLVKAQLEDLADSSDRAKHFKFPYSYLEIYSEIISLLHSFLSLITANKNFLDNDTVYAKRSITDQCKLFTAKSDALSTKFDILSQKSFDVDKESRAQLFLLKQFFDLMHFSFEFFCIPSPPQMPASYSVETKSPMNIHFLERITWARSQLAKLEKHEKEVWQSRITKSTVEFIRDIIFNLFETSFYLPRAFFNVIYSTKIRLNIKMEGKEREPGKFLVSGVSSYHPVTVEGFVETNNPAGIHCVIVHGSVSQKLGTENFKEAQKRNAELAENVNHFTLHFTFNIEKTSKIRFEVFFVDKTNKITWQANTVEDVIIRIGGT